MKNPAEHEKHIETKHKLKEIPSVEGFESIINRCMLSDTDKEILRLHYLKQKDFRFIGDELGFSEKTIKEKHKAALRKISMML